MTISPDQLLMPPYWVGLAALGLAFVLSVLAVISLRLCGPIDNPHGRAAHGQATVTSGGMAVMLATCLSFGLVLIKIDGTLPKTVIDVLFLMGLACSMGLIGAIDDLLDLSPLLRLFWQITAALIFGYHFRLNELDFGLGFKIGLWPIVGIIGPAAWIVLCLNAVNFMDGADGLALSVQNMALAGLIVAITMIATFDEKAHVVWPIWLLFICALGAQLGLYSFNLKTMIFQGDSGALFSAALIAGSILVLKPLQIVSVWFGGYLLAPFLVDVVLTLLVRFRQKKPLFSPHKEHLYQLWLAHRNPSHTTLTLIILGLSLSACAFAIFIRWLAYQTGIDLRFSGLVLVIGLMTWLWVRTRKTILANQV